MLDVNWSDTSLLATVLGNSLTHFRCSSQPVQTQPQAARFSSLVPCLAPSDGGKECTVASESPRRYCFGYRPRHAQLTFQEHTDEGDRVIVCEEHGVPPLCKRWVARACPKNQIHCRYVWALLGACRVGKIR